VLDDDEVIEAHEAEFRRPSNRGFWMIVGTIGLAGVILVGEIFANRPLVNTIATSEHDLRYALSEANRVLANDGSYDDAGWLKLQAIDNQLQYQGPGDPSRGEGYVSVYALGDTWAASVMSRTGACFDIKQVAGQPTTYGSGTICSGRQALTHATADSW
jgi:hypothetical protein